MRNENSESLLIHGEIFKGEESVPASMTVTLPENQYEPVVCSVSLKDAEEFSKHNLWLESPPPYYLQFRGKTIAGKDLWIPRLRVDLRKYLRNRLENNHALEINGVAELYVQGILEEFTKPVSKDQIRGSFTIPFTPLFEEHLPPTTFSENGSINIPEYWDRSAIQWETAKGISVELLDYYNFHGEAKDLNKAIVRVQNCQLRFELAPSQYRSVVEVIDTLWEEFDDALWILSFLSKKYIPWYEGVLSCGDHVVDMRREDRLLQRRALPPNDSSSKWSLLIKPDVLKTCVFADMFCNFKSSPYKTIILRIIPNLMIIYEDTAHNESIPYIESILSFLYMSLEMLVNSLCDEQILTDDRFKVFKEKLKAFIKEKSGLNKSERSEIYQKLNELQRFSYRRRLLMLFDRAELDIHKFWLPQTSKDVVEEELSGLVHRRNEFVHQGRIDDEYVLSDFHRIRLMIEVILLKLLGYPIHKINYNSEDVFYSIGSSLPGGFTFEKTN